MRILIFTCVLKQGYGVGLVIKKQVEGLMKKGINDIFIATPDAEGIRNSSLLKNRSIIIGSDYRSSKRAIHDVRPDIIIVHTPPYWEHIARFNDFKTIKIAYDNGEPFPTFFTGSEVREREKIDRDKYKSIKKYHIHVSISDFIKRCSGIQNSTTIYYGADHIEDNNVDISSDIRNYLGIDTKAFLISTLSRIGVGEGFYKGFDLLIRVKNMLQKIMDKGRVHFIMMGRSIPKDNPVERRLKDEGFDVLENVDDSIKMNVLKHSDIFFSPSLWEGFNLPLVEAQYVGTPSVCFSIGAHPEVSVYHFTSTGELTSFILMLYRNESLRKKCGQTCTSYVRRKFTWTSNVESLYGLIDEAHKNFDRTYKQFIITDFHEEKVFKNTVSVLQNHLERVKLNGKVHKGLIEHTYKVEYVINDKPLVSIIIPNKDNIDDLRTCISSIFEKSHYKNYEIIIVENGSTKRETFRFYQELEEQGIRILNWGNPFNYSSINNFAVRYAEGKLLLFLNNDTEVINSDWLERMMEHTLREEIGAVGAKLYYQDVTIQHAGVVIGIGGIAGHAFRGFGGVLEGYAGRLKIIQNVSAVTGACMMIRRSVFDEVGGFDEKYTVALNDVDLCLKIRNKGYLIVWTPYAELYHHELKTRGEDISPLKKKRWFKEVELFQRKWEHVLDKGDEYYNLNLTLEKEDFSIKIN